MKILHIIYTHAVAGAEKYLLTLLPGLKHHDVECDLICICPKRSVPVLTAYCDTMRSNGIKTTLISGNKKNFLSIAKTINDYLKREAIKLLHSHLSNADLIAVLVKIIYNKKIFIISSKHGYDERYLVKYSPDANPHLIDRNFYYYFTKFLLSNTDVNLATSKGIADLYFNINLTSKPFHFIHHGFNAIESISTEFANGNNLKMQLIIVGRLEKVKGHKFLIEAMPEIISYFPGIKLLILGEGSENENLVKQVAKAGINDNVIFMGFKNDPYKYILHSDILIQPSIFEAFGLVYIEGFALKVPVIAFDAPAANEIITDNETGILVPKFNSEILAQKIIFLLQNPGERKRIVENAFQIFLDHFIADRMITETAHWYKTLTLHTL